MQTVNFVADRENISNIPQLENFIQDEPKTKVLNHVILYFLFEECRTSFKMIEKVNYLLKL